MLNPVMPGIALFRVRFEQNAGWSIYYEIMNTIASPSFFVKTFLSFRHLALFYHSAFRHFLYNDSRRKTSLLPGRNQGFLSLFCEIHLPSWRMILSETADILFPSAVWDLFYKTKKRHPFGWRFYWQRMMDSNSLNSVHWLPNDHIWCH